VAGGRPRRDHDRKPRRRGSRDEHRGGRHVPDACSTSIAGAASCAWTSTAQGTYYVEKKDLIEGVRVGDRIRFEARESRGRQVIPTSTDAASTMVRPPAAAGRTS